MVCVGCVVSRVCVCVPSDWDNLLTALYNVGQSITNIVASGERLHAVDLGSLFL